VRASKAPKRAQCENNSVRASEAPTRTPESYCSRRQCGMVQREGGRLVCASLPCSRLFPCCSDHKCIKPGSIEEIVRVLFFEPLGRVLPPRGPPMTTLSLSPMFTYTTKHNQGIPWWLPRQPLLVLRLLRIVTPAGPPFTGRCAPGSRARFSVGLGGLDAPYHPLDRHDRQGGGGLSLVVHSSATSMGPGSADPSAPRIFAQEAGREDPRSRRVSPSTDQTDGNLRNLRFHTRLSLFANGYRSLSDLLHSREGEPGMRGEKGMRGFQSLCG